MMSTMMITKIHNDAIRPNDVDTRRLNSYAFTNRERNREKLRS